MKKYTLISTFALSLAFVPLIASAQITASSTIATEAQILTACSQTSIEIRDSAIGSARTSYNNAMSVALVARKDAEKEAVAIMDESEKKNAVKLAVEEYKKAVTQAQDGLTKARKEAWSAFEANTKACREPALQEKQAATTPPASLKRDATAGTHAQMRNMSATADIAADQSATASAPEPEEEKKSLKDIIFDSIRSFFK